MKSFELQMPTSIEEAAGLLPSEEGDHSAKLLAGGQDLLPEMVAIIDDDDRRQTTCGMAEATVIPGQSAIANAVYNACGVRVRDLPLTADKIVAVLARRG